MIHSGKKDPIEIFELCDTFKKIIGVDIILKTNNKEFENPTFVQL